METKQTAVEWLEDTINQMIYNGGDLGEDEHALRQHIQQAKAMEKEQIKEGYLQGIDSILEVRNEEEYYNKTYREHE